MTVRCYIHSLRFYFHHLIKWKLLFFSFFSIFLGNCFWGGGDNAVNAAEVICVKNGNSTRDITSLKVLWMKFYTNTFTHPNKFFYDWWQSCCCCASINNLWEFFRFAFQFTWNIKSYMWKGFFVSFLHIIYM